MYVYYICFVYLCTPILGTHMFKNISSSCFVPFIMTQFPSLHLILDFVLMYTLSGMNIYPSFLLICICMEYPFLYLHFQFECIFSSEMSLLSPFLLSLICSSVIW